MKLNLLPYSQKEFLKQRQELRGFLLLLLSGVVFLVSFGLHSFALKEETKARKALLESVVNLEQENLKKGGLARFEKKIEKTNLRLKETVSFATQGTSLRELLTLIDRARPEGVVIEQVWWDRSNSILSLRGVADKREQLLRFQANLKKEDIVFEFDENSWIKPYQSKFTLYLYAGIKERKN